ncbi:MAG: lysostaphin resistance A-like protein [Chloroflexus sp.]|uniref:lysostaphin resistance A-like protein n=1 Tax=Chloroflexus sp. TaxID=1904827 RepID=UPI004049C483
MSEPIVLSTEQPPTPYRPRVWLAGVGIYIFLVSIGISIGGEFESFTAASFNVLPFAILAILAYFAGTSFNWAWIATGLWLMILIAITALLAFGFGAVNIIGIPLGDIDPANPPALTQSALLGILMLILGIFGAIGIGFLTLLPPVRRRLARFIPIEPASFVHTIALAAIVSITLMLFVPLLLTGEPPLLALVRSLSGEGLNNTNPDAELRSQVYGLIWTIPAALLAVGFGIRRNLSATLSRLGLVMPTSQQFWNGIGLGVVLAIAMLFLLSPLQEWIWQSFGWPTTDEDAFLELMSYAISPIGAVVIGVTAGLGEELAIRGVLQPRLGILLSNLFFVSLHAFQYHWDGLLVVFVIGIILGLIRKYTNTTTAALVHGTYNFVLVMLTTLAEKL